MTVDGKMEYKNIKRSFSEGYAILIEDHGFGPMDGGCLMFAKALRGTISDVLGKETELVVSGRGIIQDHFFVKVLSSRGDYYIDYEGIYRSKQAVTRQMIDELLPTGTRESELTIRVITEEEEKGLVETEDLIINENTVAKLKKVLSKSFNTDSF